LLSDFKTDTGGLVYLVADQWKRVRDGQTDNMTHIREDCLRCVPEMAFSVSVRVV